MISVSILGIKENLEENLLKLDKLNIDFFHIDVMDGKFVNNKTWDYEYLKKYLSKLNKKLDVHLMVENIEEYIDFMSKLSPEIITFHYEATETPIIMINKIRQKNIKVGMAINPDTNVEQIKPLLKYIDLILVMSVVPGMGGQKYIENTTSKLDELTKIRENDHLNYLIEVDGGINNETKEKAKNADILVVGSYITNGDYKEQLAKMQN